MADEQAVGVLQFVIIVAVSVIFGGILVAVVLYVGGKKNGKAEDEVSGDKKKAEESEKSAKTAGKNAKRAVSTKEHSEQFCVLKGHTSDVLHIAFSSNGKILGSTSTGIA